MSTLGHQYDNSLVSNAFGFLRLPLNFQPYDSDAEWVITGVPFDICLLYTSDAADDSWFV